MKNFQIVLALGAACAAVPVRAQTYPDFYAHSLNIGPNGSRAPSITISPTGAYTGVTESLSASGGTTVTATNTTGYGGQFTSGGFGVQGVSTSNTGSYFGVWGISGSPSGIGVYGNNTNGGWGGYFQTNTGYALAALGGLSVQANGGGAAVATINASGAGLFTGTPSTPAVTGNGDAAGYGGIFSGGVGISASSATGYGGQFTSGAFGLQGISTSTSGSYVGTSGSSASPSGYGVQGVNSSTGYGGLFQSTVDLKGVLIKGGFTIQTTGGVTTAFVSGAGTATFIGSPATPAVTGTGDASGTGATFTGAIGVTGTSTTGYGGQFTSGGFGVKGVSTSNSGAYYGVWGTTASNSGIGVYGVATNGGYGGYFQTNTGYALAALGGLSVQSNSGGSAVATIGATGIVSGTAVGVNTSAPNAPLEVFTSGGTGSVQLGTWTGGANFGAIYLAGGFNTTGAYSLIGGAAQDLYINRPTGKAIHFRENNAEEFAILAGGALQFAAAYTVATLPTCNAGEKGAYTYVTDASAPAYNATLAGSGAVIALAFCNGTNWTAH